MSQVSTLPSPSYLNGASLSSNTNPPDSEASPAELLRQAALSSRKLKRRKLDTTSPPAPSFSRPPPRSTATTPSISLDYGQEEHSTPASPIQQPLAPAPARIPTPTRTAAPSSPPRAVQRDGSNGAAVPTPQDDDASMREEGEISDNEDPPFRPPPRSIPAPITLTGVAYPDIKLEPRGSVQSPRFGTVPRSPSFIAEVAYRHATPPGSVTTFGRRRSTEGQPPALKAQTSSEPFRLETPLYVLDADHVRPGLSLTQKQYDTAKEAVLDILGYGVPPEYLIDCGISQEIIYYVFTELNLRLPNNIDTAGIPSYPPPPDVLASILFSQSGPLLSPSATTGPPVGGVTAQPGLVGHGDHSARPSAPQGSVSTATPPVTTTASFDSSLSASVLALSESTLTAIERQRKEELLARKAAQASRKRKESVPPSVARALVSSTVTAPMGTDLSAKSSASAVSVEDFFNSIELPLSDTGNAKRDPDTAKAPGLGKQSSPEPMSVDEGIPGFGQNTPSEYDRSLSQNNSAPLRPPSEEMSLPQSSTPSERSTSVEQEKGPPTHKASQGQENLPIRSRSEGTPQLMRDHERDSRRSSTTPQPTAPIPRRGTKRPVAADFDSEPVTKTYTPPGLSRTGSGTGFSNGTGYHPNPHVRRKMNGVAAGGFASLNSARRCVIDVSDSEDDTSEDEMPSTGSQPQGSQSSARDSALALELEIERMRKMIREREEMKLRKQVMTSSRSTPVSRQSPAASRAFEGETCEIGASSSATKDEIPRSEPINDKASENEAVLATSSSSTESCLDVVVNCPSPISSTPSPPASPPLSPFQDNAQITVDAALTDQYATPADDGDQLIGGPALVAESRQESAASSRASTPAPSTGPALDRQFPEAGPARGDDVAVSAQVSNGSQVMAGSSFTTYDSVLPHYPLLSGRSLGQQEMADMPNLQHLRMQTAARRMTDNSSENARICQFEVPGGGECRDAACGDVHLSQLEVEPNDEETAHYLCGDQNVAHMVQALQAARTRRPEATFDERVNEVWTRVRGLRTQVTFDDKT